MSRPGLVVIDDSGGDDGVYFLGGGGFRAAPDTSAFPALDARVAASAAPRAGASSAGATLVAPSVAAADPAAGAGDGEGDGDDADADGVAAPLAVLSLEGEFGGPSLRILRRPAGGPAAAAALAAAASGAPAPALAPAAPAPAPARPGAPVAAGPGTRAGAPARPPGGGAASSARSAAASSSLPSLSAAAPAAAAPAPRAPGAPAWSAVAAAHRPPPAASSASGARLAAANAAAEAAEAAEAAAAAAAADARPLCSVYQAGSCRYGAACRFRHALPSMDAIHFFRAAIAGARAADDAAAPPGGAPDGGEDSGGSGGGGGAGGGGAAGAQFEAGAAAWAAASGAPSSRDALLAAAVAAGAAATLADAETALHAAEREASASVECGVCLERVTDAPGRRFGLLTGCTHAFCLECIRAWRARVDLPVATTRACPVCRRVSFLIIPCDRFVADAGRKAALHAAYAASTSAIPCRYFDEGRGVCPFGTSCAYRHQKLDGTLEARTGRHTFRIDADGQVLGGRPEHTLASFL